jgi:hypothetical protein
MGAAFHAGFGEELPDFLVTVADEQGFAEGGAVQVVGAADLGYEADGVGAVDGVEVEDPVPARRRGGRIRW